MRAARFSAALLFSGQVGGRSATAIGPRAFLLNPGSAPNARRRLQAPPGSGTQPQPTRTAAAARTNSLLTLHSLRAPCHPNTHTHTPGARAHNHCTFSSAYAQAPPAPSARPDRVRRARRPARRASTAQPSGHPAAPGRRTPFRPSRPPDAQNPPLRRRRHPRRPPPRARCPRMPAHAPAPACAARSAPGGGAPHGPSSLAADSSPQDAKPPKRHVPPSAPCTTPTPITPLFAHPEPKDPAPFLLSNTSICRGGALEAQAPSPGGRPPPPW
ncbi:MAG: hypothetical protein J3K34DRAFT_193835 [Monoraphidium minutum]|nr:MAG: hypothetical protein J3K34DRAFT_193835 [Monoraphidium minutum]